VFNFEKLIKDGIQANNRTPDYKLHPSTHLSIPLRRLELDSIGYPKERGKYDSSHRLLTGTLWHEWLEKLLRESGRQVSLELDLTDHLPTGWSGRLDCLLATGDNTWDLYDFKTTGDVTYVRREPKWEHVQQANLHADAADRMVLVNKVYIVYIGMNTDDVVVHECTLPRGKMAARANELRDKVKAFKERSGCFLYWDDNVPLWNNAVFVGATEHLSPGLGKQERWQWNKFRKGWGAYYGPANECKFCPYPSSVCCKSKDEEDVYLGIYYPQKGKFYPAKSNTDYGEPFLEPPDYVLE
jgi:hypothetical protein